MSTLTFFVLGRDAGSDRDHVAGLAPDSVRRPMTLISPSFLPELFSTSYRTGAVSCHDLHCGNRPEGGPRYDAVALLYEQ